MNSKILEASIDVIVTVDKSAVITEVSSSIERMFGYSPKEVIGQPLVILLPERFRQGHDKMFQYFVENPEPRRMGSGRELMARRKDGTEFYVDVGLSYYVENGRQFYAAIVRDISDLKHAEIQLKQKNEELLLRNKELDQFAHIVSHDLKSPVNMLIQSIDLINLQHQDELSDEVREYFAIIKERSLHVRNLVDGILSYSVATGGKPETSEFKLSSLLQEIKSAVDIPKHITLKLPEEDIKVHANKIHLYQVLSNLVRNAIKYHNKPEGIVKITTAERNGHYMFEVIDDGPGIAEDLQSGIFEMFTTAHSEDREDSSGIGLAIVKRLVDTNGGNINLVSKEGKGCHFNIAWKKELD